MINSSAAAIIGPDQRVLVITDGYHVFRARRVFARHFRAAEAVGTRPTAASLRWAIPREIAAVAIYWVRGDIR